MLSTVDKKILKVLLNPDGGISSSYLSRKLGIPQTTIQRRRKRLEKEVLKTIYTVDLETYKGWIDVKWTAMENATRSALASVTTHAIHTLNDTASQFATHSLIAASGLPLAAGLGFVPGLVIGFKRG